MFTAIVPGWRGKDCVSCGPGDETGYLSKTTSPRRWTPDWTARLSAWKQSCPSTMATSRQRYHPAREEHSAEGGTTYAARAPLSPRT